MKSILYIGATIMIGASIYGFVDYQKTSRNREFKKMYTEPVATQPVVTDNKTVTTEISTNETEKKVVNTSTGEEKKTVVAKVKQNKRKKLRISDFSRAPIREEELVVPVELKKTENKDQ